MKTFVCKSYFSKSRGFCQKENREFICNHLNLTKNALKPTERYIKMPFAVL